MEVTISMLIAAIAIAITYTAYHIVSTTYIGYTKKQDRVAAFAVADQLLRKDFFMADHIIKTADGLEFQSPQGNTKYRFLDTCILRNQYNLQTDTFRLKISTVNFSFENEAAIEGAHVDQLNYSSILEGEPVSLRYHKTYSAQNLFK